MALRRNRLQFLWLTWMQLLLVCGANGQQDSIFQLPEIEVTAQRIDFTDVGKHTDQLDSQAIMDSRYENLASMISWETPLHVRTYGNGSLATLGIRGGSASHTQVLWNGIPLRNPMIGLVDLALIPSAFMDHAAIHYGGHGAAFGSGAVGGLISFNNEMLSGRNAITMHLGIGSWDSRMGELKLDYGFKKLRFSTRLFSQFAENNYRYKLDDDLPERNQVHHQLKNQGLLQEVLWTLGKRQFLTARLWYQYADRQIPPTSTQTTSKSAQQDENLRASIQWTRNGEKINWQIKTAWLDETIDYQDSLILLYTHNQFQTWLAEGETSFRLGRVFHFAGGYYTEVVRAKSENYLTDIERFQNAVFATLRYAQADWVCRIQMREEVTDTAWSPVLIDLSAEWSGIERLTLKAGASRNYRTPTLNDLNWRPGGNPDLLPERGWTLESGVYYHTRNASSNISLNSSVTLYARVMDQWIMWMPPVKDVSLYWSPINITEVNSKGIEGRGALEWPKGKWIFLLNAGFDFTWSTFGASLPEFTIEEGDQLFYVPVENVLGGLDIKFLQWSGYYRHHWFGPSNGINEDLESGNVGSAGVTLRKVYRKFQGTLYLQADNIWNVPYRIIERRPMPGRSWSGGIKVTFL